MLAFALGALAGGVAVGAVTTLIMVHTQRLWDQAEADDAYLAGRLAECLDKIITAPLLTVNDPEGFGRELELRLSCFDAGLAEQAALLLEEAGR